MLGGSRGEKGSKKLRLWVPKNTHPTREICCSGLRSVENFNLFLQNVMDFLHHLLLLNHQLDDQDFDDLKKMLLLLETSSISSQHRTLYNHALSINEKEHDSAWPIPHLPSLLRLHLTRSVASDVVVRQNPRWNAANFHLRHDVAEVRGHTASAWPKVRRGNNGVCRPLVSGKRRFQSAQGWLREKFTPP